MSLLWSDDGAKGKRVKRNPQPKIPNTGWVRKDFFPDLSSAKVICFDVETKDPDIKKHGAGWGRGVGHIIGLSMSTDDGFRQYYPIRHEEHGDCNHDPYRVLAYASEQLGRPRQKKLGHNIIYDLGWLAHEGVVVKGEIHDTWTAEKLIDHEASASLESCGQRHTGEGKMSDQLYDWAWEYWGVGPKAKSDKERRELCMANLYRCPPELVGFYAESDVTLPLDIAPVQFQLMEDLGLWDVYRLECDLIEVLVQMRLAGVSVDLDAAEQAYHHIEAAATDLQNQVNKIAGRHLNTGSPIEMRALFDKLRLPYNLTETEQMSLTGEFLQTVTHPIGKMVIDLEELKRYNSAFIQNAILNSNVNGKIHCTFKPLTAITGRMSCSDPNLQQVPGRNDLAKKVRSIFIPDPGHDHWRKYDYSSIESRILAHYAEGEGAEELREEYRRNPETDYHTFCQQMVKRVVGLELNRKNIKNVNFAGIYGAQERKLQAMMRLTDAEAESFFAAYHEGLPYVRSTMKAISEEVEERGYSLTVLGRRANFDRWEPKWFPKDKPRPWPLPFDDAIRKYGPNIKRSNTYKGLNYTIQGSAADLMKSAMVQCWKQGIFDRTTVPRLVVHDEIDVSVREGCDEEAFKEMVHIMETAIPFRIPVRVSGEWGNNWSNLYPLE
jgi:DNA polymerase I-like protein with 3'-5' exonuclease and polymerase domains